MIYKVIKYRTFHGREFYKVKYRRLFFWFNTSKGIDNDGAEFCSIESALYEIDKHSKNNFSSSKPKYIEERYFIV